MSDGSSPTPAAAVASGASGHLEPRVLIPLALLTLYVVWGSTYLGIRFALESYPPFLLAGVRFLAAGVLLYGFLRWRGHAAPTRLQWRNAAFTGLLLLGMGNGLVCFAEERVSSGIAAVAVSSMPLFAAAFGGLYGHWPSRRETMISTIMVVIFAMGIGLFAPPFGVGYYGACAISRVDPSKGIRAIGGYIVALFVGLVIVAAIPWISIGFLKA